MLELDSREAYRHKRRNEFLAENVHLQADPARFICCMAASSGGRVGLSFALQSRRTRKFDRCSCKYFIFRHIGSADSSRSCESSRGRAGKVALRVRVFVQLAGTPVGRFFLRHTDRAFFGTSAFKPFRRPGTTRRWSISPATFRLVLRSVPIVQLSTT